MPDQLTPQRLPINDCVAGVVTRVADQALFSSRKLPLGQEVAQGEFVVRYGITYLGRPQVSIVPDLVVADYGELLQGESAWSFLIEKGHLYPRADVCGWRNDGLEDMLAVKQLDFDYPYHVFIYRDAADSQPLARLSVLIAADRAKFPARVVKQLPTYPSLDHWRAHG